MSNRFGRVAVSDLWRLCNALIGAGKSVDLLRLSSERVAGLHQLRSPSCLAGAWKRLPACHSLASAHLSKSNSSFSAKPLPRDHVVRRLLRKALIPLTQRSTLSTIQAARRGRLAIPLCQLAPERSGISPLTALPGEEITIVVCLEAQWLHWQPSAGQQEDRRPAVVHTGHEYALARIVFALLPFAIFSLRRYVTNG